MYAAHEHIHISVKSVFFVLFTTHVTSWRVLQSTDRGKNESSQTSLSYKTLLYVRSFDRSLFCKDTHTHKHANGALTASAMSFYVTQVGLLFC